MSKLNFHTTITKPGTQCEPKPMPLFEEVVSIRVSDMQGLVKREVDAYIASLPFANVECITVQKAADLLNVYADTVRVYIRNRQLKATKLGKDYRIRIVDLEKFLQEKQMPLSAVRMHHKQKKVS